MNLFVDAYEDRLYTIFIQDRPSEPEIDDSTWQLIQRCCAKSSEDCLAIDEVVEEMQSWE
jgi:hypothetical protein